MKVNGNSIVYSVRNVPCWIIWLDNLLICHKSHFIYKVPRIFENSYKKILNLFRCIPSGRLVINLKLNEMKVKNMSVKILNLSVLQSLWWSWIGTQLDWWGVHTKATQWRNVAGIQAASKPPSLGLAALHAASAFEHWHTSECIFPEQERCLESETQRNNKCLWKVVTVWGFHSPWPGQEVCFGGSTAGFCSVGISLRRIGSCFCPCWGNGLRIGNQGFSSSLMTRQPHIVVKPCVSKCLEKYTFSFALFLFWNSYSGSPNFCFQQRLWVLSQIPQTLSLDLRLGPPTIFKVYPLKEHLPGVFLKLACSGGPNLFSF